MSVFDIPLPEAPPPQAEEVVVDRDVAIHRLIRLKAEVKRRQWNRDPVLWAKERLGDTLWSGQRRILESIRDNRRTAVASCHEIGKSFTASLVVGWWLDSNPPGDAFVVTSAPTNNQVRAILWREIGRVHARGKLAGRVNQTEWLMSMPAGNEELVAFGRKPDDYDPTAFQGIHAVNVLVIFDEACGIPGPLWEAADSLIANDQSKMLCIGNPDDPETHFATVCAPGSGWNTLHVSAFDSPNFTGEPMPPRVLAQLVGKTYAEEKRRKYARLWIWVDKNGQVVPPDSSGGYTTAALQSAVKCVPPEGGKVEDTAVYWQSKVLGVFPPISAENSLIPISWIRRAQERSLPTSGANELGVDVGGGADETTIAQRRGYVVRILESSNNPDTMQMCGLAIATQRKTGATVVKADMIGIGKGMVDRAKELGENFVGISSGESPREELDEETGEEKSTSFANLRSQLWWMVRTLFETNLIDIDPEDEELAAQLSSLRFNRTSSGKIQMETKKAAKDRGVSSPNRADALLFALAPVYLEDTSWEPVWGRRRR